MLFFSSHFELGPTKKIPLVVGGNGKGKDALYRAKQLFVAFVSRQNEILCRIVSPACGLSAGGGVCVFKHSAVGGFRSDGCCLCLCHSIEFIAIEDHVFSWSTILCDVHHIVHPQCCKGRYAASRESRIFLDVTRR